MSLSYTHLLVPSSPSFRVEAEAVGRFVRGLIDNGNVAAGAHIALAPVTKGEPCVRQIRNPMTGETIDMQGPTRTRERPQALSDPTQIAELAANHSEYDLVVTAKGIPAVPPMIVGYVADGKWKAIDGPYHLEIRCRVRGHVVRLSMLDHEDDLTRPPDFANYRPKRDEDCSPADHPEGVFVHPEKGAFRVPHAGCGMFWIEFSYGNFIFPRLKDGSVNVLADSIVALTQAEFDCDFVQACQWG